jgi:lipopolysaccharide export system permease protein
MDTLDRYLIKEFFVYLAVTLLCLTFLFVGIDYLSNYIHSAESLQKIFNHYLYRLPFVFQQFIPVSCLMATLLVLTALSRQNEILALFAGGISVLRIVSTFIAATAAVSTLSFIIFDPLLPALSKRNELIKRGIDPSSSAEELSNFNRNDFWLKNGALVYNIGNFDPAKNTMRDIRVYSLSPHFYLNSKMKAKRAIFQKDQWIIQEGSLVTYPLEIPFPTFSHFKEKKAGLIFERPKDIKTFQIKEDTMRLKELRKYINRNSSYGMDTTNQQVQYHERIAMVFTPLILVLISFPFAMKPFKQHSAGRSVGFCFLVVFAFLLLFRLTLSVGKAGYIPPLLAAWGPNLFFLVLSGIRLLRF